MLSGHGDDGYLYPQKIKANFSSNVYYPALTAAMKDHLSQRLDSIKNYPETQGQSLVEQLSLFHQLEKENILLTNGATEAFYLIAQSFRDTTATIVIPTFSEYEDACKINKLGLSFINWEDLSNETTFKTELVFICNPNNPTGSVLSPQYLQQLLTTNSGSTFVIDEAYIDFTNAIRSCVDFIHTFNNLIIVKSLTKAYAIPGLRLGYILSNSNVIARIGSLKMPWSVNVLALEAGKYILANHQKLKLPLPEILERTTSLNENLNHIPFIEAKETHTNFFLCKTKKQSASLLKKFLIENFGILIRDASNFRGLDSAYFRICAQSVKDNELLIKAFGEWGRAN